MIQTIDSKQLDKALALAGVFQAALLVKQLATTGRVDDSYFKSSVDSLFKFDAIDVPDVFGGIPALTLGLKELIRMLTHHKTPSDSDIARYVLSLLHLERKLAKKPDMQALIQTGMTRAKSQSEHFSTTHENVLANIAGIYTDSLSTLNFRIYISGEPLYLNQTHIVNKIRTLLLAGIRSSILWRQLGGRRWQLLISRRSILEAAQKILVSQPEIETIV